MRYDNAHGVHHRHYMGKAEEIIYRGFGDIRARFDRDLASLFKGMQS